MGTEVFSNINWFALLIATLAYFMLGALWYSKALFGNKWAALVKLDVNDPKLKEGMAKNDDRILRTYVDRMPGSCDSYCED